MSQKYLKPGVIKDASIAALFSNKDPEGRYQDLREIGHGSFGAVYYAYDKDRKETVAIKKMNYSGKSAAEKWTDIIKEVSFLSKISHVNIVDYKACFLKETVCWLVMEYCIGSAADIVDVLRKGMKEEEIVAICAQTLSALTYLHSLSHIHRDIKAGNILLSDSALVKLADFGSAAHTNPAQTFIGTPFFMAPEVIMAMDEGVYNDRSDIWSLGITCIELAERRPPLFSMNTMSALYHIAQNDPPGLAPVPSDQPPWSSQFVDFVSKCLRKLPEERMSAAECTNHVFIKTSTTVHRDTIRELIARTKNMVTELDNFQYRKMRKLIYLDDAEGKDGSDPSVCDGLDENTASSLDKVPDSISSRSVSLTSFRSNRSINAGNTQHSDASNLFEENSKKSSSSGQGAMSDSPNRHAASTIISIGEENTYPTAGHGKMDERGFEEENKPRLPAKDLHMHRDIKDEINTLTKFSTLRPAKLVNKEQEEYTKENNMYEQMSGYKRLRQQHHKEMRQFEERCAQEREILRIRLDRELENLNANLAKERQRERLAHDLEVDKKKREIEDGEKKLKKQTMLKNQQQMKAFVTAQQKEYKHNKEAAKANYKARNWPKTEYENAVRELKAALHRQKEVKESEFEARLRLEADEELIRYRRQQLSRLHSLEQKLNEDDLTTQSRQTDARQSLLMKQHEMTRELELGHLRELHQIKRRHQEVLHEAESTNQTDYMKRTTEELRKKHTLQSRQQPRELKVKEAQIRKQYRQAVKTQTKQFKLLQTQILAETPREEQKEVAAKLKEQQMRKIASLGSQYDTQIHRMVEDRTVKLESWQEDEAKTLAIKLEKELDQLSSYQKKQREILDEQIAKEKRTLEERVGTRRALLEQRMCEEHEQLEKQRTTKTDALHQRHSEERQRLEESFVRTGAVKSHQQM